MSAAFTTKFMQGAVAVPSALSVSSRNTAIIPKNQRREKKVYNQMKAQKDSKTHQPRLKIQKISKRKLTTPIRLWKDRRKVKNKRICHWT